MKKLKVHFQILLVLVFTVVGCDKNNDPAPQTSNEHVNSWILEKMDFWYYWRADMPADPDKTVDPEDFFESLKSNQDRFSWIQSNFTELINSLRGVNKEDGFEFALYRENPDGNTVIAQILYVKDNSPASAAGLHRGDVISHINSTQITVDNYREVIGQLSENHSITYKQLDVEAKTLGEATTINLVPVEYAENPNFLSKVVTFDDHKIGYYVYNLFSEGATSESKEYTAQMDNVFASFKSQGITDLVLDLRFNSGGAESAAQNLASLIVKNITSTTVFAKHEYNEKVTAEIKSNPNLGEGFLSIPFLIKTQNVGSQLRDARVYVLTGSRTASASELIINGLKPFMDVYLVGNTTVGKNVGSITLYDETDSENKYGIQPIVTKILNNAGQSDYSSGFVPQTVDADNSLYLYPLGDNRENLFHKALVQITGSETVARSNNGPRLGDILYHSLDSKERSGVLFITNPWQ